MIILNPSIELESSKTSKCRPPKLALISDGAKKSQKHSFPRAFCTMSPQVQQAIYSLWCAGTLNISSIIGCKNYRST